jgi:hypothetical protein
MRFPAGIVYLTGMDTVVVNEASVLTLNHRTSARRTLTILAVVFAVDLNKFTILYRRSFCGNTDGTAKADFAVIDSDIEPAVRIYAYPCLIPDGCALSPVIG